MDAAAFAPPNLSVVRGEALCVDLERKELEVKLLLTEKVGGKVTTARLRFDVLIAATGAVPKRLLPPRDGEEPQEDYDSRITYLRDADSVAVAAVSLRSARRVVVAGNGGIALGLAHALGSSSYSSEEGPRRRRKVIWAAKHGHVGDAFFDIDAAAFLAKAIGRKDKGEERGRGRGGMLPTSLVPPKAVPAPSSSFSSSSPAFGAAVGPGWVEALTEAIGSSGRREEEANNSAGEEREQGEAGGGEEQGGVDLHLNATVTSVEDNNNGSSSPSPSPSFPLLVTLSDGSPPFACDAVVSAVGVRPDTSWLPGGEEIERSPASDGGGVLVDARLRSSVGPSLLACGDACTLRENAHGERWFQMRLWSQARATGAAAGRSAAGFTEDGRFEEASENENGGKSGNGGNGGNENEGPASYPHALELFAHATSVAGLKVILLGLYNGQGLEEEPEEDIVTFCREEEGEKGEEGNGSEGEGGPFFARALLLRGKLAGAVLIGETGLEGVFEDLILDGIDVSFLGPRLLDPDLDLEAIFD